jgi:hypothetical protein
MSLPVVKPNPKYKDLGNNLDGRMSKIPEDLSRMIFKLLNY